MPPSASKRSSPWKSSAPASCSPRTTSRFAAPASCSASSQSGQMTEIGLALYLDLLEEAVQRAEGRPRARARQAAGRGDGSRAAPAGVPAGDVHRATCTCASRSTSASPPRRDGDGTRRAHRRDHRPLRHAAAAGAEPAAHRAAQAHRARARHPAPGPRAAGRLRAVRGDATRSTPPRSSACCRRPRANTASKGR